MKIKLLPLLLSMAMLFGVSSCDSNEDSSSNPGEETGQQNYTLGEVHILDSEALSDIEKETAKETGETSTSIRSNKKKSVKSVIITTPTDHPSEKGVKVDMSAVILFPGELEENIAYQFVIVTPPTYTHNGDAPSSVFKRRFLGGQSLNALPSKLWALAATDKVVVVLDYLGYGASYGQCDHPYLDQKAMVKSTTDVIAAAREAIKTDLEIELKEEGAYVTGYSQGAWVANSIVHEVETNPTKYDWSVKMLLAGGTPANLNDIAIHTFGIKDGMAVEAYLLPLTLFGYVANNYPELKEDMKDIFLEPYGQKVLEVFKGDKTAKDLNQVFPKENNLVYTPAILSGFATNSKFAYVRSVLYDNSLKPWGNKCEIIAYHGLFDTTVPKNQAVDYYKKITDMGGTGGAVKVRELILSHTIAFVPYFYAVTKQIDNN